MEGPVPVLGGVRTALLRKNLASDLDRAITVAHEASALAPPAEQTSMVTSLAVLHGRRFRLSNSEADVHAALRYAGQAYDASEPGTESYGFHLFNVAGAHRLAFRLTADTKHLSTAIDRLFEGLRVLSVDDQLRPAFQNALGDALARRYLAERRPADLDAAIVRLREGSSAVSGNPEVRIDAAHTLGKLGAAVKNAALALEGFSAAADLIPAVAHRSLRRRVRLKRIARLSPLTRKAAAWAVTAGRPGTAAEILERGRLIFWSQILQENQDLSEMREDLSASTKEALQAFERVQLPAGPGEWAIDADTDQDFLWMRYDKPEDPFDPILHKHRAADAFTRTLGAISAVDLRQSSTAGPVVLINMDASRSDALVFHDGRLTECPLPGLTLAACMSRVSTLQTALAARDASGVLFDTLAWLWHVVAQPVLHHLGWTSPPASMLPRLWWCPTGPLTFLPLQAVRPVASEERPPVRQTAQASPVPARRRRSESSCPVSSWRLSPARRR